MISKLLVKFYGIIHGKLHLRGGGWLIRRFVNWIPGLQSYSLSLPKIGTAVLDFRDGAAFGMLNFSLGDFGNEAALVPLIEKFLKPNDVLWDIGANIGIISAYFAHPRHNLRAIYAFEPNPVPFKSLQSLFQAHPRVKIFELGLGRTEGSLTMNAHPFSSEVGSLALPIKDSMPIKVEVRSGDAVLSELNLQIPDVIKIDVEGFELETIAGLSKTIIQNRPVIFFEHHWLKPDELEKLALRDYQIYWIHDDGLIATDFLSRSKGHDAILVPLEKDDLVKRLRGS